MNCPICGNETHNMMYHILNTPDSPHVHMLLPVVKYTRDHARNCYAFEIATKLANDDTITDAGVTELKSDMVTLTAFISRCIPRLGYNRRRCISFDRQEIHSMTPNIDSLQGEELFKALLELCTLSVPRSVKKAAPDYAHHFQPQFDIGPQNIVEITKIFSFAAAHHLPGHSRLCQYTHGHEWKLEVTVRGFVDPTTNMVMDFSDLKAVVKNTIIDVLDHNYINDILWNPTAENLCAWILEELKASGVSNVWRIKLWEAQDSFAILENINF